MKNFKIGFIFLILFCFFRPLAFVNLNIEIWGLNIFELFAIIISYVLLFALAINVRKIKYDFISFAILMFCFYCFISIYWGSQLRIISQVTLPFILFYAARVMIRKQEEIKFLISVLVISYSFLLIGSLYQIFEGTSIKMVESITGIERHTGIFQRIKPFSFSMFFFSVVFYFQVLINQLKSSRIKFALLLLLMISFFCIFKSYSRSAYIGLAIFWPISLWGYNKKYCFSVLISLLSIVIGLIFLTDLEQIFFKTQNFDINVATSGRIFIWKHNISLFLQSNLEKVLAGHGLGAVSSGVIGGRNEIWSSHNDYLHVLMSLGSIGLVLYILIY